MFTRIAVSVIFSGFLASCSSDSDTGSADNMNGGTDSDFESIEILSFKLPCFGVSQRLCLQTGDNGFFYDSIEGFDFVWGHTYELSVEVSEVEEVEEDASSLRYELSEVVSDAEDSIGTTYDYERVSMLESTFTREADVYQFLAQPFTCAVDVDCDGLVNLNNSGGMVNVTFEYIGNGEISLVQWN